MPNNSNNSRDCSGGDCWDVSHVSETDSYEELSYSFSDLEWCESYPVTLLASNNCGENTVIDEIHNIFKNEILIIAGKGHENKQVRRNQIKFFDDVQTAKYFLTKKNEY